MSQEYAFTEEFARRLDGEARWLGVPPDERLAQLLAEHLQHRDGGLGRITADHETSTFALPDDLARRVVQEAIARKVAPEEFIEETLERAIAPAAILEPGAFGDGLEQLRRFLDRIPCLTVIATSRPNEPTWWMKLEIDLDSRIAWHVVQYLSYVLNELSIEEPLPTVFKPSSPPPYLNGGPREFLSWAIEATIPLLNASIVAGILEERLLAPVDDESAWLRGGEVDVPALEHPDDS